MRALSRMAGPAAWLLSKTTDLVVRLLGFRRGDEGPVTDEEVKYLMREGAEAGHFHEAERAIVEMALRLGDRRVSALMTPRPQIEFIDLATPGDESRTRILESHYSRFPVVEGGFERVVGILEAKDLLGPALAGEPFDLRRAIKPPVFIPDTVPALKALEQFKQTGAPVALIVDEYGDIQGLVTLNDLLESLVGDIATPGLNEEPHAVKRDDGSWLIDGMVPIDEVKDLVGLQVLPAEDGIDYQTLGGFMMAQLKRIPQTADSVEIDGYRFEVMDMDGRRVDKVLVVPPPVAA
jgi:putative hemolysin